VFLICSVLLVLAPNGAYAFGAGDIADFSYLNDKAFRHGDIENILATLAKTAGRAHGDGLMGFATSLLSAAAGGSKFSGSDIKKVYFGNWLRDYSQARTSAFAMDIAGLSKLSADTIVLLISVLGFMTFGFATEEFEVTADRLGVYLPVEHIDNPKGYAEKEGDARQFHQKLRPPVRREELEIDERTGMKNYMATENRGWDTSTAHIRRTLEKCIEHGRRSQGREGPDLFEAYRLLGTALHTLEDLLAHSNWCELALKKMGYNEVFCHVGDRVTVNTPNGRAPPLVTGTFGSADFIHSLMGEATDHLSENSVTNLYDKMNNSGDADSSSNLLQGILSKFSLGGGSNQAQQAQDLKQKAFDFDPDKYAPKEAQEQFLSLLKWRDGVYRDITKKIEMVPGLENLLDQLTNALNAYVYTLLAPWLTPIIQQATSVLSEGSQAVIDSDDQYEVFNSPNASDPSHSILSKDHFGLILNEPAGKIAQVVVCHTVNLIVQAWSNNERPDGVINNILEAFHHPYFNVGRSQIQNAMMEEMQRWFGGLGEEGRQVLDALTKDSVRNGKNKRLGSEDENQGGGHSHGSTGQYGRNDNNAYSTQSSYGEQRTSGYTPAYQQQSSYQQEETRYTPSEERYGQEQPYGRQEEPSYGESRNQYGRQSTYGQETSYEESAGNYGRQPSYGQESSYEQRRYQEQPNTFGRDSSGYGAETRTEYTREEYSAPRNDYDSNGRENRDQQEFGGYGARNEYDSDRRSNREERGEERFASHSPEYGRYGGERHGGHHHKEENSGYYGGGESYPGGSAAYGEEDRE
ncbi:Het-C-domain-containing protein, partial [Schizopora paradoxa]